MNWIDLVWLLLGLGLGLGSGWLRWRTHQPASAEAVSCTSEQESVKPLLDQLKQTELAYQMASEMSQFKGGFLARTSHELRSPLNGLIGMHQLILSDLCDGPEEEREFVAQANESALKMVAVLDSLIEVSKIEHGSIQLELQPIQLAHLLEEVRSLTHLQAKNRNLRLQVSLPDPEVYIQADPRRLRQVLVNLIHSAISALPEGEIRVAAQPVTESGYAHIWIEDDRPAVEWAEAVDRLKMAPDPKATVPSAGLTLLVSQTLLTLMQGRLELQPASVAAESSSSSIAQQTRLQCSLPLILPEAE